MIARLTLFLALLLPAGLRAAEPEATLYSSDQLLADLTTALTQHFHADGELQLDLIRSWSPPQRSAQHWDFAISEYPGVAASNMLLRIRLKADGVVVDESSFVVHAELLREVWFTRNPIVGNTAFEAALFEARRIDVLRQRDTLAAKDGDDSWVISHDMGADKVLTWHDVARRPMVHRGQVVDVRAAEGQLLLTMKALCMENGARGDLVTVRNLETRKDISAIVTGDQQVQVHF